MSERPLFLRETLLVLRRCSLRHWRLAFWQYVVLVLILAMGTGVYLAMRLANRAALAGFEQFTEGVTKQVDWSVQGVAGPMPAGVLRELRDALEWRPVHLLPVVDAAVTPLLNGASGDIGSRPAWRVLGLDWIGLQNLRGRSVDGQGNSPTAVPGKDVPGQGALIGDAMAQRYGLKVGQEVEVIVNDKVGRIRIAGVLPVMPGMPSPPDHLLLMDLPEAQRFLLKDGKIDRVEVIAQTGTAFPNLVEETGELLRTAGQGRWVVMGRDDRRAMAGTMTAGFRLNLTILSLLALLVGCYLIFQALDGVVVRRRGEIGILKALGVTSRVIRAAFLVEAALLGIIAGVLGVVIGWVGAQAAVGGVSRTVNALYGASSAPSAPLDPGEVWLSMGLSLGASLVAAWFPAAQAARTPAAWMLGHSAAPFQGGRLLRTEWLGWAFMLSAAGVAQIGPLRLAHGEILPLAGYFSAFLWLLGAGLAAGAVLRWIAGRAGVLRAKSAALRVALSSLRMPTVRHRFAVAALASAVAMTAGMAIMVASFDHTMRRWIDQSMKADLLLASGGAHNASSEDMISASVIEALREMPEVAELAVLQARNVLLPEGPSRVLGAETEFIEKHDLYAWVEKPESKWWVSSVAGETPALINESFGERFQKHRGDELEIPTSQGMKRVRIAGVYADYGNERGSVTVARSVFTEWYRTESAWRAAIMLKSGTDADAVQRRIQAKYSGLSVFTNGHLRSEALRIFRQTFSVTYAIEVIGVVVAVGGLCLALMSLFLERRPELMTMRALGMTHGEIAAAGAGEGVGVALAGTAQGLIAGVWLGWLLIYRVNKQCFGWTLGYAFPWGQMLGLGIAVVVSGALVAALVGRWGARLPAEQED